MDPAVMDRVVECDRRRPADWGPANENWRTELIEQFAKIVNRWGTGDGGIGDYDAMMGIAVRCLLAVGWSYEQIEEVIPISDTGVKFFEWGRRQSWEPPKKDDRQMEMYNNGEAESGGVEQEET